MKTKIMIWISTLFAVAFISLATAQKVEAQSVSGKFTPGLHNGRELVVPGNYYVKVEFGAVLSVAMEVQGYCQIGERRVPFYVIVSANTSSSNWVHIYSDYELTGDLIDAIVITSSQPRG